MSKVGMVREAGVLPGEFDKEREAARKKKSAMEVEHRSALVEGMRGKSGGATAMSTRRAVAAPLEEVSIPGQNWFLVNIAHQGTRPHSETPSLRVCGVFEDIEDLRDHVKEIQHQVRDCDWWVFGRGEHFLLCPTPEEIANLQHRKDKGNELFRAHGVLDGAEREKQFNASRRNRKPVAGAAASKSTLAQRRKAAAANKSSRVPAIRSKIMEVCENRRANRSYPSTAVVRNQNFVALSYLHDVTPAVLAGDKSPEPLVILWACFADQQQAKEWVEKDGSRAIVDMTIDVMDMYEFPPFELVDDRKIKTTYRHGEHDAIMKGQQEEAEKVQRFRKHCDSNNIQASETVVDVVEKEVLNACTGATEIKPVTTVTKAQKRPFEARALGSAKPLLSKDQVGDAAVDTPEDEQTEEEKARIAQSLREHDEKWEREGVATEVVRDYFPGEEDAETLARQAAAPRNREPFQPRVDPSLRKDAKSIFRDNVGLPGSMLVANSDGGGPRR